MSQIHYRVVESLSAAKLMVLLSILQKIISFLLSQTLIRFTTPEIFGLAAVQLELWLSTLFIPLKRWN